MVIAAVARGLNPDAVLVRPSVQLTKSRVWSVKHTAKLSPADCGELIA
jgi:hypothetical protein